MQKTDEGDAPEDECTKPSKMEQAVQDAKRAEATSWIQTEALCITL